MLYDIKKSKSTRFGLEHEFSIEPEHNDIEPEHNDIEPEHNDRDDWVRGVTWPNTVEFSECNKEVLKTYIKPWMKLIVEIGVSRNGWENSSTKVIHENKTKDCVYYGMDIRDVEDLSNAEDNLIMVKRDSLNVEENIKEILKHGEYIDLLMIDGDHSVYNVSREWDYAPFVRPNGGVILAHDTTSHPGPYCLAECVDRNIFDVKKYCLKDYGISAFIRK